MICSLTLLVSESRCCTPGLQGGCTVNLSCMVRGSVVLSEHHSRLGTVQEGCSKDFLAGILPHTRNFLVQRISLMLSFQNKREPLLSAWLILLSVAVGSEVVTFRAMFLRNLTQIPPTLEEIKRKQC